MVPILPVHMRSIDKPKGEISKIADANNQIKINPVIENECDTTGGYNECTNDMSVTTIANICDNESDNSYNNLVCKNNYCDLIRKKSTFNRYLKVLSLNVQAIRDANHLDNLINIVSSTNPDIICIQETWLRTFNTSKSVEMPGYNLYRCDRKISLTDRNKGGGVGVYIKSAYKAKIISTIYSNEFQGKNINGIEFILIDISTKFNKLLLFNIYRTSYCSNSTFDDVIAHIVEKSLKYEHVIGACDLNINKLDRKNSALFQNLSNSFHCCNDSCPTYIIPNINPSQIDFIFSKIKHRVISFHHFDSCGISNHQSLYMNYNILPNKKNEHEIEIRNYQKIDMNVVDNVAGSINWHPLYSNSCINFKVDYFNNIISDLHNTLCPRKVIKTKHTLNPWMNDDIKNDMKTRNKFRKMIQYNKSNNKKNIAFIAYKNMNKIVKRKINAAKKQYFLSNYNDARSNKRKWNIIHSMGITSKSKKIDYLTLNDNVNADSLNKYFLRNNTEEIIPSIPNIQSHPSTFSFTDVDEDEIVHAIHKIKSNASGDDNIPLIFFKIILNYILYPIINIINTSFQHGIYPNPLKSIKINPIPKISSPINEAHYRPICCVNVLAKIISIISNTQLTNYVEKNNMLNEHQSGFRKFHSCTTAVLDLSEEIYGAISSNKCIFIVLVDFANAFPSVNHSILIKLLESLGLDSISMKWYKSLLNNWKQHVVWNGKKSEEEIIKVGVFQGEGNSQILFNIFINPICSYIKNMKLRQFADDTCLTLISDINHNSLATAIRKINDDLRSLENFCSTYKLNINPMKSSVIIVSSKNNIKKIDYQTISPIQFNNIDIQYVDVVKYLGLNINREFSNEKHINEISKKSYFALSQLYPLKYSLPTNIKLNLIKSLIIPIFDYMDVVYHEFNAHGSISTTQNLQKMFNNAIRFVYNLKYNDHISPYLIKSNLLPLKERRETHLLIMIHKILSGEAPNYLRSHLSINTNNTRSKNKLIVQKAKNNNHKKSLSVGGPVLWNKIDEQTRTENSSNIFKSHIIKSYLNANGK